MPPPPTSPRSGDSSSSGEDEYDPAEVADGSNPLFSPPQTTKPSSSLLGKTPKGRLTVSVLTLSSKKKSTADIRVRFALNGYAERVDEHQRIVEISHYAATANEDANEFGNRRKKAVASPRKSVEVDKAELVVEVNDAQTDAYFGSGVVNQVDLMFTNVTKPCRVQLVANDGTPVGELDLTISYHKYSPLDALGIRWKWFVAWPHAWVVRISDVLRAVPDATRAVVKTGLPGLQGGAASWVVMGALCVPFLILSVLTNWSWATRRWFLVVPLYSYLFTSLPVMLGWLFGTLVTVFALHNYPGGFRCGALHITPWIRGYALQLRITAIDLEMGNPPGYPLPNFWSCKRADVAGSISFRHLIDIMFLRYKKCPLKKVPDFRLLAKWDIDYIEVDDFFLDFMLYNGVFNILDVTRLLAEHEARQQAWLKGYMKKSDPMPNELEIRIVRAKDLTKTRMSKGSLRAQAARVAASSGPLGRNAVFDAFLEEDSGDDDDDNAPENPEHGPIDELTTKQQNYGGLGPPQFNPFDAGVKPKRSQGHFDPYVMVSLRRDKQKTKTQSGSSSPMWNETFHFHATDAATVVLVQVFNREVVRDRLIGQWMITLKYLLSDPTYCWHERGLDIGKDRWIRGWFPLINKSFRGVGKCGKLEMAFQWRYVPDAHLKRNVSLPKQSALEQMQENSEESRLRMGDMARLKYWLNHEPFLFDVKRMSVFSFRFYVTDLFLPEGAKGGAETKAIENIHLVDVPRVDWLNEYRPRHGDEGITLFKLLYRFFANVAPKVLNSAESHANVGRTLGILAGSAMKNGLRQMVVRGGGVASVGSVLKTMGKSTDRAIQLLHRTVTQNKENEAQFKIPVDANDDDFLIENATVSGYLGRYATQITDFKFQDDPAFSGEITDVDMEKESKRKGSFHIKFFELKGKTLFYRKNKNMPKSAMYGVSYKIPLREVVGAIYFKEREELMLNMQSQQGIVTRFRLVGNEKEEGDDEPGVDGMVGLDRWLAALKSCGVPCFEWQREQSLSDS